MFVMCGLLSAGLAGVTQAQSAPVGIPRALAQERAARVSGVRYGLSFTLVPHARSTQGTEQVRFSLKDSTRPLLLDFRDGVLRSSTLR